MPGFRRALLVIALSLSLGVAQQAHASNPIQLENAKAGDPRWTLTNIATNGEIEGYASATSVNRGESISIYVSTVDPSYQIDVYRLGWYGGAGARKLAGPILRTGVKQPIPSPDPQTGLVECNWTDPYVLAIPATPDPTDWCSGVYLARLTGSSGEQAFVMFVVRDDGRASNHYFQSSVTTFEAYNNWGGKSLYEGSPQAAKVSFNRPYAAGAGTGDFLWRWEYNMLRFLEREGFDVTYCTNIDTARRGTLIQNHRSLLSVGHDEYWSADMRNNLEAARDKGVSLGFFSGNDGYWQIRLEPGADGTADRTIVGYKEKALKTDPYALDSDPSNDIYITTSWRSAPVSRPEASLIGVQYIYNPVRPPQDIVIDDAAGAPWVFANTGLVTGSKLTGLLGYEVDAIAAASPSNVVRLGHSFFQDTTVSPAATGYSDMTVYTAASGATVFATGSIQWAWGLDDWNSAATHVQPIPAAQQLTRNVLRRFAAGNATYDCQYTLVPASASVTAAAGTAQANVNTAIGCSWSATSSAPWVTVNSPTSSVDGNGTISYGWSANAGPARSGAISVADKTFTIQQADGCAISLSPAMANEPSAGASGTFQVTAASSACSWTAVPGDSWVTVTSGSSGSGSGTVGYAVAANNGTSRTSTIAVADQLFTISQQNGCTYSVSPTTISAPIGSSTGTITITTDGTCHWQASTTKDWITLSPASGQGSGTVSYQITSNSGAARSGSLSVAGTSVAVSQDGVPCTYSISPTSISTGPGSSTTTVTVTAPDRCAWAASSSSAWLSVSPSSGSGAGTVTVSIGANTAGVGRQGFATIAAQRLTVNQGSAGAFSMTATGTSDSTVALSWTAVAGAASYQVSRSAAGGPFVTIGSAPSPSFNDTGLPANTAFRYQVVASDGSSNAIATSNVDVGSTIVFADDPLVAGVTPVKAVHVSELRAAIDTLRRSAGLASFGWTVAAEAGQPVTAAAILEMRTATDQAYSALALPARSWSAGVASGGVIRAVNFQELRDAVH